MRNTLKYVICLALTGGGALPAAAAQTAIGQTLSESTAHAVREHLDEAEDLTESMLRWKHSVTGVADGDINLRKAPATTAISINRADAQRLNDLIAGGAAGLVTIDRTSLERLAVELDAIELIVPRMTRKTSR